jgi:hypothetical protein
LQRELNYLARENQDLFSRRKYLERFLYTQEAKQEFVFGGLPSQSTTF